MTKLPASDPTSGSESEDDDFVPEETGESLKNASSSRSSVHARNKATKRAEAQVSDEDSDDENSEDDAEGRERKKGVEDDIDADELEALKRERAELIAAAGGEGRLGKRRRTAQNNTAEASQPTATEDETEVAKKKALAEWEAMKGSDSAPNTAAVASSTGKDGQEGMISIPSTYKFAGEVHATTRLVPRSHPDAVKYLAQKAAPTAAVSSSSTITSSQPPAAVEKRPPPGPRRKKGSSLAAMSAAATAKPTKLNTLEKSKLDWDQFKGNTANLSQQELDELENQTKGGGKGLGDMKGYLERRDFLDRVKDRTGQS